LGEKAFSDGPEGWAFYNGELRHNSNSSGAKYGTTLATGDVIGVALDMTEVYFYNYWQRKNFTGYAQFY